jgi:hypothetical protein
LSAVYRSGGIRISTCCMASDKSDLLVPPETDYFPKVPAHAPRVLDR